ncbi:MAG: hypothetical protein JSV65_15970 [Armatimonadota bacterium]|nr:MAG: hypothetical protein JSV65_15970 [Armatimonadota bacterium]
MAQRLRDARPTRAAKADAAKPRVIGPFSIIADKLIILAAVAAGGALIYLVYGLVSGHITSFPHPPGSQRSLLSEPAQAVLTRWVQTATRILAWGTVLALVLALLRYYDSSSTIALSAAVGGVFYVGLPVLVTGVLGHQYRPANELTDAIIIGTQAAGKLILILAAVRGAIHFLVVAVRRPRRAPVRRGASPAGARAPRPQSLLRQCWELARCQASGSACPALRRRRSCWKIGSGCLCDLRLAEKLSQGAEAWTHEEVSAVRYRAATGRRPCRTCPIYEEHQEYKYRLFQWSAYPVTALAIWVTLPLLHVGYDGSLKFLERMMAVLAFTPSRASSAPTDGVQSIVLASNVEWVFIGCLGLLLVTYVLHGIDRAVFKWGW